MRKLKLGMARTSLPRVAKITGKDLVCASKFADKKIGKLIKVRK